MFDAYMVNPMTSTPTSGFELKFKQFLDQVIEPVHQLPSLHLSMKNMFWNGLNTNILNRFGTCSDDLEQALQNLKTTKKVCDLFGSFWIQFNQSNKSDSLLNLVQMIFSKFLNKFYAVMESADFTSTSESVAIIYLKCISNLCRHFMHKSLLNSILSMYSQTNIEICTAKLLEQVDEKHLLLVDANNNKNVLTFEVIDLYLLLKSKETDSDLLAKLDEFIIKDNDIQQLDNFFDYHFSENKEPLDTNLLNWFLLSDKFNVAFSSEYLKHFLLVTKEDQSKKMEFIVKFMDSLINYNSYPIRTNDFYVAVVQTIVQLIGN